MAIPEPSAHARCWSCGIQIDAFDNYCRHCGKGQGAHLSWYYHPLGLALLTCLALGPFVLPLVWRSPKLTRRWKWAATAAVAGGTLFIVWRVAVFFRELQGVLSGVISGGP